MANYAVVNKSGVVENIVLWDGVTEFSVPDCALIEATADARIGGTYDGSFHFVEPDPPEPTAEEIAAAEVRASAIGKLKSLGLDDAEVSAIIGGAA